MLLEPPFPGGCWRPPDDGRAGPVINTQLTLHHNKNSNNTPPPLGACHGLPGRERVPFSLSPAPFLPIAPQEVKQHQVPERGAVLLFFGRGKGGKRVGPGMPQGDGPAPIILVSTRG